MLLVSIDGLRADAVSAVGTPALWTLLERGSYTLNAQNHEPTFTIPNHVSMLTGLSPETHGVVEAVDAGDITIEGTVLALAQAAGFSARAYLTKEKLDLLCHPSLDRCLIAPGGAEATRAFTDDLRTLGAANYLAFLHFAAPDSTGHRYGWMSPEYLSAVAETDQLLAKATAVLDLAETTVFVTSDHGGVGHAHVDPVAEVRTVPWVAAGGEWGGYRELAEPVRVSDTFPTILVALGLEVPKRTEGRPIEPDTTVPWPPRFVRGDVDGDGGVRIADAVSVILRSLGLATGVECPAAADADGNERADFVDGLFLLRFLFLGGSPPPRPYPGCGVPNRPLLGCRASCP